MSPLKDSNIFYRRLMNEGFGLRIIVNLSKSISNIRLEKKRRLPWT